MNRGLKIGDVAKLAGVSVDTLRYYEKVRALASTCTFIWWRSPIRA